MSSSKLKPPKLIFRVQFKIFWTENNPLYGTCFLANLSYITELCQETKESYMYVATISTIQVYMHFAQCTSNYVAI